jgi:uncharacterized Zn finger protein
MITQCQRCSSDFEVPQSVINSLITAASHCQPCTDELANKFLAIYGTKAVA